MFTLKLYVTELSTSNLFGTDTYKRYQEISLIFSEALVIHMSTSKSFFDRVDNLIIIINIFEWRGNINNEYLI